MQEHRLAARDIACRRGDRVLFHGLSLEVHPGEALHVAGINGIGKSSLLRILAGLLRPFSGEVEHQGTIGLIDERAAFDPGDPVFVRGADVDQPDLAFLHEGRDLVR